MHVQSVQNTVFHCQICKFVGFCCRRRRGCLSSLFMVSIVVIAVFVIVIIIIVVMELLKYENAFIFLFRLIAMAGQ